MATKSKGTDGSENLSQRVVKTVIWGHDLSYGKPYTKFIELVACVAHHNRSHVSIAQWP